MKTKILDAGNNIDDLWALISDDIQDGFEKVVSKMDERTTEKLSSDIASYKSGCVFVEFLASDFEQLFWKIEDKYELPLGYFEKFYDELVDPVNFVATKEIKHLKKKKTAKRHEEDKQSDTKKTPEQNEEEDEPEAIETGSSSSEEEDIIEEVEDVDENNDYSDDDYDPNDEDNYSDDSENDSILSD